MKNSSKIRMLAIVFTLLSMGKLQATEWKQTSSDSMGYSIVMPDYLGTGEYKQLKDGRSSYRYSVGIQNRTGIVALFQELKKCTRDTKERLQSKKRSDEKRTTYESFGNLWFVRTGYDEQGQIFYQKYVTTDDLINCVLLEITYPEKLRNLGDAFVQRSAPSLTVFKSLDNSGDDKDDSSEDQ